MPQKGGKATFAEAVVIYIFAENHRFSEKTPHPAPRSVVGAANLAAGRRAANKRRAQMLYSSEQTLDRKEPSPIARSKRVRREVGKPSKSGILGIAGLVLLLGSGPSWAQANPTVSNPINGDTAGGSNVLVGNTTGEENTASGFEVLVNNTTGAFNTASGGGALVKNTTGDGNTAVGVGAGQTYATGSDNTFIGTRADVAFDGLRMQPRSAAVRW
jgi:hypothetical protein